MEHQNPLEQMRLAADNYNRYGHYMAALKNYHHVVYQMTHDYDSEMTRQFKADTCTIWAWFFCGFTISNVRRNV